MYKTVKIMMVTMTLMLGLGWSGSNISLVQAAEHQKKELGFFHSLWGKMRSMMPRRNVNANQHVTAVIGVRGAETTETALNPHWEQDLSSNPTFQSDMKSFDAASLLCDQGEVGQGIREFEGLVEDSSFDTIQSNGLLALAACYDQQGNKEKSLAYLKSFAKKYPKHPLAQDVLTYIK